jgi:hypothetical protein
MRPSMRPLVPLGVPFALCCLVLCLLSASFLLAQPAPPPAAPPLADQLPDEAAYVARQFGPTFTVDRKVAPMFGDLDGDGNEDLVLVATSPTPLLSQELLGFKVEDPYNAYFGTADVRITSQFTLHFDGSERFILIVFGWRLPPPEHKAKHASKFVLINTPFESATIASLRFKKKNIQAIEAVDRTTLHSLILWDGKHWRWSAQGMEGDEALPPSRH